MEYIKNFFESLESYQLKIILTILILITVITIKKLINKLIHKSPDTNVRRERQTKKIFGIILGLITIIIIPAIWGLRLENFYTVTASIFAVLGVAFFAQWSFLSNITAGVILYFNHPLKIGDTITINEGENSLTGEIDDITFFFLHIKDVNNIIYTIPNNIIIQKTINIHNPN